jgi:hypothetical protein
MDALSEIGMLFFLGLVSLCLVGVAIGTLKMTLE